MGLEKAIITNGVTGERIPVLFNPEEYTVSRDNNFAQMAVPGLRAPLIQFVHGNMKTLEMELLVDTHEKHEEAGRVVNEAGDDVRTLTDRIIGLMDIDATTHAPPHLLFTWGTFTFTCVLASGSQRFIMFRSDGIPVRARLQVTFNEFTNAETEAREVKRETSDYSSIYTVVQNDTVSAIAERVYGNPALWRPIALRNAVDDPRRLEPGRRLLVPRLPYRDPRTGELHQ